MLKGRTSVGEISAAYTLLSGMEWGGIKPNDTSYNRIENSAVCSEALGVMRGVEACQGSGAPP